MTTHSKTKEQYRDDINKTFSKILEEKGLKWVKGWTDMPSLAHPYNGVTGRPYNGLNQFSLTLRALSEGFDDPRFYTFAQIVDKENKVHPDAKWHLQKGSKASIVEYFYPYDEENKKSLSWKEFDEKKNLNDSASKIVIKSKYYYVYNANQIDGINPIERTINRSINQNQLLEKMSKSIGVGINYDGNNRAYYSPLNDEIHLPTMDQFNDEASYIGTALHELSHATGHETRLNRNLKNSFGSPEYAKEELVAEISSALLSTEFSDVDFEEHHELDNSKAYVQTWLKAIENDSNLLIDAIKKANESCNYILDKSGLNIEYEYQYENPRYEIYQVENRYLIEYGFEGYDSLIRLGKGIDMSHYSKVYEGELDDKSLEDIYQEFNINHPIDYTGRSLSVSDIVIVVENKDVSIHYCDVVGFKDITEELLNSQYSQKELDDDKIDYLANEMYRIIEDADPYEAWDYQDIKEDTIQKVKIDIKENRVDAYKQALNSIRDNSSNGKLILDTYKLEKQLETYHQMMSKVNNDVSLKQRSISRKR